MKRCSGCRRGRGRGGGGRRWSNIPHSFHYILVMLSIEVLPYDQYQHHSPTYTNIPTSIHTSSYHNHQVSVIVIIALEVGNNCFVWRISHLFGKLFTNMSQFFINTLLFLVLCSTCSSFHGIDRQISCLMISIN
jgi:hypothetical protein